MSPVLKDDTRGEQAGQTDPTADSRERTAPESEEKPAEVDSLPKDVFFGLLSAKRRRDVLGYLDESGGESTLGELAEHIAASEEGIPPSQLSSKQRKRVYVALYQCHLPKMDDADVIDYNQPRGTVELRPEGDQLFEYLSLARSETDSSGRGFLRWVRESAPVRTLRTTLLGRTLD